MQNAFIEFANVDSMIEYGNSLFDQVFLLQYRIPYQLEQAVN